MNATLFSTGQSGATLFSTGQSDATLFMINSEVGVNNFTGLSRGAQYDGPRTRACVLTVN